MWGDSRPQPGEQCWPWETEGKRCAAPTPRSATPAYKARTLGRHEVESLKQQGLVGLGAEEAAANEDAERKLTEFRDHAMM